MEDLTHDGLRKRVAELEQAHMAQAQIAWHHYQRAQLADLRADDADARLKAFLKVAEAAYWSLAWTWQDGLDGQPGPFNLDGLDPDVMPTPERKLYEALKGLKPFYGTEAA
jgi:hypothetical protein